MKSHYKCNSCHNAIQCNLYRFIDKLYPYVVVFHMSVSWRIGTKIWKDYEYPNTVGKS